MNLTLIFGVLAAINMTSCKKKKNDSSLDAIVSLDGKSTISLLPLQDQANLKSPIAYGVVHCSSEVEGDAVRAAEVLEFLTTKTYDSLGTDSGKLVYNKSNAEISYISKMCAQKGKMLSALEFAGTVAIPPKSDNEFYTRQVLWLAARGQYTPAHPTQGFTGAFYQFLHQSLGAVDDDLLDAGEKVKRVVKFDEWYNPCSTATSNWQFKDLRNRNFDCKNNHYQIKASALDAFKSLEGLAGVIDSVNEQPEMLGAIAVTFGVSVPRSAVANSGTGLALQDNPGSAAVSVKSNFSSGNYVDASPNRYSSGSTQSSSVKVYKPIITSDSIRPSNSSDSGVQSKETSNIISKYEFPKMERPKPTKGNLDPNCNKYLSEFDNGSEGTNKYDCVPNFWSGGKPSSTAGNQANSGQDQMKKDCANAGGSMNVHNSGRDACYCQGGSEGFAQAFGGWVRKENSTISCRDFIRKMASDRDSHKAKMDAYTKKVVSDRQLADTKKAQELKEKAVQARQLAEQKLKTEQDEAKRKQAQNEINEAQRAADAATSIEKQIKTHDKSPEQINEEEVITPPPGGVVVIEDGNGDKLVSPDPTPAKISTPQEPSVQEVAACTAKGARVLRSSKQKVGDRWVFSKCDCGDMGGRGSFTVSATQSGDCASLFAAASKNKESDAPKVAPEPKLAKDGPQICKEKGGNYQGSVCACGPDSLALPQYVPVKSSENCRDKISAVNSEISACKEKYGQPKMDHAFRSYSCNCEGYGYRFAADGKCRLMGGGFWTKDNKRPEGEFQPPPDSDLVIINPDKKPEEDYGIKPPPAQDELEGDSKSSGGLLGIIFGPTEASHFDKIMEGRE